MQQHVKAKNEALNRLLIADEVGLGKTIEIGLVLCDILISFGALNKFRCLYLTKGGLREDAKTKLQTVLKGSIDEQHIVEVVDSFLRYGRGRIEGIHVASMDAARRYVSNASKRNLPEEVAPDIVIIDECHYCSCNTELTDERQVTTRATQTYQAAYQLITGQYWPSSTPPKLVVLMSATPFRSRMHFVNLLRLLTHQNIFNAFDNVTEDGLVGKLQANDSNADIIWRQQGDVSSWSDQRLFPSLTVERVPLTTTESYLQLIQTICDMLGEICKNHGTAFGGFAKRHLQIRLTSSSIAGACWIFRWCVRHQSWETKDRYRQDTSTSTEKLRTLIVGISRRLAQFRQNAQHVDVVFPSDRFEFLASSLAQGGKVDRIYEFINYLRGSDNDDEENNAFIATENEILSLTNIALDLLELACSEDESNQIENTKLNWLKKKLEEHEDSKFLVFTESLQTCKIITQVLPNAEKLIGNMGNAQREAVVRRFRGQEKPAVRAF